MNNGIPETKQELLDHVNGQRAALVDALEFFGGEATTYDLREYSEVPAGSIHYHLDHLIEWDVVEKTGRQKPIGSGGNADVYRLTRKGEAISTEVSDSTTTADEVVSHEERLETLEDQMDRVMTLLEGLRNDLNLNGERENNKKPPE